MIKEFFKLVGNVVAFLALMALMWLLLLPIWIGGHGVWGWILSIIVGALQCWLLYWLFQKMHADKKETDNTLRF